LDGFTSGRKYKRLRKNKNENGNWFLLRRLFPKYFKMFGERGGMFQALHKLLKKNKNNYKIWQLLENFCQTLQALGFDKK